MILFCKRTFRNDSASRGFSVTAVVIYVHVNSGVRSHANDYADRYTRNVTSFGIFDVTKTSDVISRCDVQDEKVVAAQYGCSPAPRQVTTRRLVFDISVSSNRI